MIKQLLFILITVLILLTCVRLIFGVDEPIKTIEIFDYLGKMPAVESKITDIMDDLSQVLNTLTKVENDIRAWTTEKDNLIADIAGRVALGAMSIVNIALTIRTVTLGMFPVIIAAFEDFFYFIRVIYYLIYGAPL